MNNKYWMDRYERRKSWAIGLLGGKCVDCGSTDNLEFDHINPEEKLFAITSRITWGDDIIIPELMKCQLKCKAHHKAKHSVVGTHGTVSTYRYCKCELCMSAQRAYMHEYRKKHKRM